MNDLDMQKFSDRIDVAAANGIITAEQARLTKSALEGGGMEAAIEALHASEMAKGATPPDEDENAAPGASGGFDDGSVSFAEDLADLRDALNRDLGSKEVLDLVKKIAAAVEGHTPSESISKP